MTPALREADGPKGLRLVHSREIVCWPAHLAFIWEQPTQGADCQDCGAVVAQPVAAAKERPVCLYCAIERGLIPAEDTPLRFGAP